MIFVGDFLGWVGGDVGLGCIVVMVVVVFDLDFFVGIFVCGEDGVLCVFGVFEMSMNGCMYYEYDKSLVCCVNSWCCYWNGYLLLVFIFFC